ncbi:MAG: hypothetical protein IKK52_01275 [Alphaproteobacteria bacterium]|nr:hypothetical protein [Alphaproteobacteria bacterium]
MNFIKHHWFGALLGLWMVLFIGLVGIVLAAPHYDAQNRGFAFCTQNLADNLADCERESLCSMQAVLDNTWCDIKIIAKSFTDWIDGKNPYPWSGYIFEPEQPRPSYFDDEEIKAYLKEYPDTLDEMERLKNLRKDMENAQDKDSSIEKFIP